MKVSAVLLLVGLAAIAGSTQVTAIDDVDILNFALNLEYLEAEFYQYAVYGKGLTEAQRGGGPAATGGKKAMLSGGMRSIAKEIASDELKHVLFLRLALGTAAVAQPAINIGTAFADAANAAAQTAGVIKAPATLSPAFSPYGSEIPFLLGAFIFEDVGVTAYMGAAALITSKDYLTAAAGILSVEAYHAGAVRALLYQQRMVVPAYGLKTYKIVAAISALRAAAGGGKDEGIIDAGMQANIVPTDANSIAFARTTAEVISIVTLGGMANAGGFFPAGLNGNIK